MKYQELIKKNKIYKKFQTIIKILVKNKDNNIRNKQKI